MFQVSTGFWENNKEHNSHDLRPEVLTSTDDEMVEK